MEAMADRLQTALTVHRSGHGGRVPARAGGQDLPRGAGGWCCDRAQRPEGGCLPYRGGS